MAKNLEPCRTFLGNCLVVKAPGTKTFWKFDPKGQGALEEGGGVELRLHEAPPDAAVVIAGNGGSTAGAGCAYEHFN